MGAHKYNKAAIAKSNGDNMLAEFESKRRSKQAKMRNVIRFFHNIPWKIKLFINGGYMR